MSDLAAGEQRGNCGADEASQFDFWLGHWRVTWDGDKRGTNRISKVLGGCVIQEDFDGRPGVELRGKSLSVFDESAGVWRQTWVDNSGGYMDFVGGWQGDRMELSRVVPASEGRTLQRMLWFDIDQDAMTWNWERSEDGGESWQLVWQLRYERLKDN